MAENEALIPYPYNREIILRQRDSVVVYDPAAKQLVVRNHIPVECPYCHQPLNDESHEGVPTARAEPSAPIAASFASPEYFRMLHHSLPGSTESSRPPSPRRRLTHALRGDLETPLRAPPGTEFMGSSPAPKSSQGISSSAFSPNYFSQFYVEERELGRGGKGVVLLVKHVLDGVSLGHFALKRIPVGDDHEWLEKVLVEVQLLQHLSHQNLVSYRHVWLENAQITTFGPSVPCAFVLQQYCNAGDLQKYIFQGVKTTTTKEELKQRMRRRSKHEVEPLEAMAGPRRLQFEEIRAFFKDITAGLNHLHINNYIHRDLKPSNCLLHDTGKELRVLVSDFGEVQSESQMRKSTGATGTISYCAPEVLRCDPSTGVLGNFSAKSDIFSLGMILYFLCFAKLPYQSADNLNEEDEDVDMLRQEILAWVGVDDDNDVRAELPDKLYRFLRRLLSLDPLNRPTAEETLHAIKTGSGLDGSVDGRSRAGGHIFEGIRRVSRISPISSPLTGSPKPAGTLEEISSIRNRASPPRQLQVSPMGRNFDDSGLDSEDGNEKHPAANTDEKGRSGSLILRSGHGSPVKTGQTDSPSPSASTLRPYFKSSEFLHTFKVAGFMLKILSIYLPCQPMATNPVLGLSLLGLATVDLLLRDFGLLTSFVLIVLHFFALLFTSRKDLLCLPKASVWEGL